MAVLGRWAWLVGGSGGDLTIDAYKLDLAPRYAQKNSRPEVSAEWPFDFEMPRQRQIKLRAASSLGQPRPIGRSQMSSGLACHTGLAFHIGTSSSS